MKGEKTMSFDALTAYLDSLDACGIPARDLSVWQDHRQIYRHMSGSADGEKRPVTARDIYWQYSTTKVVCCTAALRAVEDGLLSLDDCVEAYLPAFGKLRRSGWNPNKAGKNAVDHSPSDNHDRRANL